MSSLDSKEKLLYCYVDPAISSIGILACTVSLFIFMNSKFKENFFNYIRLEIIFNSFTLICVILRSNYYCKYSVGKFSTCLIHILNRFLLKLFEMTSILSYVMSSIQCYFFLINLNKKYNFFSNVSYKFICFLSILISGFVYFFRLFEYSFNPESKFSYSLNKTNFINGSINFGCKKIQNDNKLLRLNKLLAFIISDGLLLILLSIFNILIFFKVRKSLKNKVHIQSRNKTVSANVKKSTLSIKLMVCFGSLNAILSRIPFVFNLIVELTDIEPNSIPLVSMIGYTSIAVSISNNFFLYYFTNVLFRQIFSHYLCLSVNFIARFCCLKKS
jgi:hypothetical protein